MNTQVFRHGAGIRLLSLVAALSLLAPIGMAAAAAAPKPAGPQTRVDTGANAPQQASIAADARGSYVVTWTAAGKDGSFDIFARRYDVRGQAVGREFVVNNLTAGHQGSPTVGMTPSGEFVVVWSHQVGPSRLHARRFDVHGVALGPEFKLNPGSAAAHELVPRLAMRPDGGFVVAWTDITQSEDVYVRRFDANGQALGAAVRANSFVSLSQNEAHVAVARDGGFVVVWTSSHQDIPGADPNTWGDARGVYAQRFAADATPLGSEFRVAQSLLGQQSAPRVSIKPDGSFTIVWSGAGGNDANGAFLRRFDSNGQPLGGEIAIADDAEAQSSPDIAVDALGNEFIVWRSSLNATDWWRSEVRARLFDASGVGGKQFDITGLRGRVGGGRIAVDADGDFVVIWSRTAEPLTGLEDPNGHLYIRSYHGGEPIDLTVEIGVGAEIVLPGVEIEVDVRASNAHVYSAIPGVGTGSDVSLNVTLPLGWQLVSVDAGSAWQCPSQPPLNCKLIGSLDASVSLPPLRLVVRTPRLTGSFNLRASIAGHQEDPQVGNNKATRALRVMRK